MVVCRTRMMCVRAVGGYYSQDVPGDVEAIVGGTGLWDGWCCC